jgi:hypothetical protein
VPLSFGLLHHGIDGHLASQQRAHQVGVHH